MKGIAYCGACADYDRKKHRCKCGATQESNSQDKFFDDCPLPNVAPVMHGRWIEDHDYLKCPECGIMVKRDFTFFDIGDWNYCPNCADKLKSAFETCDICKECPSTSARCAYECTEPDFLTPGIRRVIDAQPTVDAVPVIRCRDCKFRYWDDWIEEYCCRRYEEFYASYDGFCSSAEQREGEEE